jgi:hypothetical protein
MRQLLAIIVVLLAALPLSAGEPTQVQMKLDAADLLAGTRYQAEVRAYYTITNPKNIPNPTNETLLEDAIESPQVYRTDFIAPLDPKKIAPNFAFQFPRTLAPPPPGYTAFLVFKMKLTVAPPKSSGLPTVSGSERTYTTASGEGVVTRCFRLRGPVLDGFFYVGVADCAKPIMKRPPGKDGR